MRRKHGSKSAGVQLAAQDHVPRVHEIVANGPADGCGNHRHEHRDNEWL